MDSDPKISKILKVNEVKAIELLAKYAIWQVAIAEDNAAKTPQTLERKVIVEYKGYDGMRSCEFGSSRYSQG